VNKTRETWPLKEFWEDFWMGLEEQLRMGILPQVAKNQWSARYSYDAYLAVESKQAKIALLNQLAGILTALRLRNSHEQFEKIMDEVGIDKSFANDLRVAYTNKRRWKNG